MTIQQELDAVSQIQARKSAWDRAWRVMNSSNRYSDEFATASRCVTRLARALTRRYRLI